MGFKKKECGLPPIFVFYPQKRNVVIENGKITNKEAQIKYQL